MPNCNFCKAPLSHIFCDLGFQPPANSFLTSEQLDKPETYYPLTAYICDQCKLVQVPETKKATEIFNDDYVYFSSQSPSNVSHAKEYCDMMCERFGYGKGTKVLEIGSNDGYMLQWFKEKGCDVLGVEPATSVAKIAIERKIPTVPIFFIFEAAKDLTTVSMFSLCGGIFHETHGEKFDLICGINVLNHQPDINDFVAGLKIALAPEGVITFEFPWLFHLITGLQFDTIYHEHFSYFSLSVIRHVFFAHGLEIFDVDELPEHGGSLRIYAQHRKMSDYRQINTWGINQIIKKETEIIGIDSIQLPVNNIRRDFMEFVFGVPSHKIIVAYGAAAKANTFFNFCKIDRSLINFIVDRSPYKVNKYLPGSHIPVYDEEYLKKVQPEYVLITAWNLKDEIKRQLGYIRNWGGKFIVAIPELDIF